MSFQNETLDRPRTLVDRLGFVARESPRDRGHVFLADGELEEWFLSLHDLDRRARSVAVRLQQLDAQGQRALLIYPSGLEFLVGFFGALYAGVVAVPTYYPRLNALDPRLNAILRDSGATLALTTSSVTANLDRILTDAPEMRGLRWIATEDVADAADEWVRPNHDADSLAMLQYTSGSTGSPRGVQLSHGNLLHNLNCIQRTFRLHHEGCGVSWLPAFHDMGLIGNLLAPIQYEGRVVFMSPAAFVQRPIRWLRAVSRYRAYISGGPTFAYDLCTRRIPEEERDGLDLSTWEVAYVGAEPVSAAVLARFVEMYAPYGFRRESLQPCYGLAEATLLVSGSRERPHPTVVTFRRSDLEQHRAVSAADGAAGIVLVGCGLPMPDEDVRIVDPTTLRDCGPDEVGEVWVAGPSVAGGYWQQPEATQQTFNGRRADSDETIRYLRTGDLAFLHDGELFLTGRIKDVIIVRGRNVYPQDVEEAVESAHPALRSGGGVAFAVQNGDEEQLVIVHERDRRHRDTDPTEVFDAVRRTIAERLELEASAILLIKPMTLPRTTSGKVRRSETRTRYLADELEVVARWQRPSGELLQYGSEKSQKRSREEVRTWLVERLARHLRLAEERIDVKRPFAAYGLDSVTMVSISAELQAWLGQTLPPTLLYDAPTIEALSERLTDDGSQRRESPRGSVREPIAIVGLGCRFPGADSPDSYWQLLHEGRCAITDLPEGRWNHLPNDLATMRGGYLREVDRFDALFFGISPREAISLDPQHRLLLETTWEALENAGHAPESLEGARVGVFVGVSNNEYVRLLLAGRGVADAYGGTGTASSMAANRISYHFDFRGPSLSIDTACSSSLVAVHQACRSLRDGDCDLAVAGGVNLILSPETTQTFSLAGMLAPDGLCKTFDASANGYVRGEGCGVVILKPLSAALRDRDRVLAVIRGSAVNQDGRSNGITAPNGVAQASLIWAALRDAGIGPEEVVCVEAHGTGTRLGDPIEFGALRAALGQGERPCALGAVKTNIGHLESAAGVAGLIKMVLALHHDAIPPHLHLRQLNPDVVLAGSRFVIPTKTMEWPDGPRIAGVSSFGFGGTNAHVVLSGAPLADDSSPTETQRPLHLLTLSARSETALHQLAVRYRDWLTEHPDASIADVCYTAAVGRSHFSQRLAVPAATSSELARALTDWTAGTVPATLRVGRVPGPTTRGVAFLFTGQGISSIDTGRELYQTCPPFRAAFDRCARILEERLDRPLSTAFEKVEQPWSVSFAQPALFALEYALAETWRAWSVEPSAVLGHSLGEYVAACVAGVFSLDDGLLLIAERARLMETLCPVGAMAVVFADEPQILDVIEPWTAEVAIAARNGPGSLVLAGGPEAVSAVRRTLRDRGIVSRPLPVTRAFHSPLIEPALDALEAAAARVRFAVPRLPMISNLSGAQVGPEVQTPTYWRRHARATVEFAAGIRSLASLRIGTFLELGPEPTLSKLGPACLPDSAAIWLTSLRPGVSDWLCMLDALGGLYVRGGRIDWEAFDRDRPRSRLTLPTYPFERERYWVEAPVRPTPVVHAKPQQADNTLTESLYRLIWTPRSRLEWPGSVRPADDLRSPDAVAEQMRPVKAELQEQFGTVPPANLARGSDLLAAGYVVRSLQLLGWAPRQGERGNVEVLAEQLGVVQSHRRLFGRLLEILAEDGWLTLQNGSWEVVQVPDAEAPEGRLRELRTGYPAFEPELTLLERCGSRLAEVLRGEVDPLHLLFPGGDTTALERVYRDSPLARFANALLARSIRAAVHDLAPNRVLRILELGAGTGGATASILPLLPAERTEYVFTDVSALFFPRARSQFRAYPFVQYLTLDLERSVEEQGFAPEQFDIVIAANVLHATADLRRSLQTAMRLLTPGGMLVLLEASSPRRMLDLIFGLTEGWWKFADRDLRPNYPLLSPRRWLDLFAELGLTETAAIPASSGSETSADQVVLLARAPLPTKEIAPNVAAGFSLRPTPAEAGVWVIFSDRGIIGAAIARQLIAAGHRAIVVEAGDEFKRLDESHYRIRQDRREDLPRLLDAVGPCRGVIHLWGLDNDDLRSALPRGCGSLLRLLHGAGNQVGRIWLVTKGAFRSESLGQAALWGIGRAAREEHPRLAVTLLDLDPLATAEQNATCVVAELARPDDEPEVVFHHGVRHVARLLDITSIPTPTFTLFHDDGVYVVIGSGGLEVDLARELVRRGAGKVRIVGPHPTLQLNGSTPHPEDGAIARRPITRSAAEELRSTLDSVARDDGPIYGIVCVAESQREDLARQDGDRLAASLSPSLLTAEVVEQFVGLVQPEFVLLLSPSPPLAAFARGRATASATAVAFESIATRIPNAVCLTWSENVTVGELLAAMTILRGNRSSATLLPSAWEALSQANPTALKSPVLSWVREERAAAPGPVGSFDGEDVRSAPPARRRAVLEKLWREQVGQVLALHPTQVDLDAPLYALGLDSLMAIQLKNRVEARLGIELPLGTLLAGGTSAQVLDRIRATLDEEAPTAASEPLTGPNERAKPAENGKAEPLLVAVEQMSEADLDAVLRQLLPDAERSANRR